MPYFSGNFTQEQLHIMRQAASTCAKALHVEGDQDKEREIVLAILQEASAGKFDLDHLIAVGLAALKTGPSN
ncbi:hypothetical protein VF02_38110 [Nostoc linckia z1]|uniref:hypothetical protein n=1 Tax=Nostoc linckia TaxID=92942 RepID=UPI000C035E19|nr:hypothetical protein [Nostoc linckia]PHJ50660.1 hypothetical protein VF02_38110 [Nostoc linckia z1]